MKKEKGFTLIEVVIALGFLGIMSVAFLGAISNAFTAVFILDERTTAESLARSQMEYVRNAPYQEGGFSYEIPPNPPTTQPPPWDTSYTSLESCYSGYSVEVQGVPCNSPDDGIQKMTVIVEHHDKPEVIKLESYKLQR